MSLHLYSTVFPEQLPPAVFQPLSIRLPAMMQQKLSNYRRWQDAHASLFGKLLLEKALQQAGLEGDLSGLQVTDYGRPYLKDKAGFPGEGLDFNISHSGNRVVCVLSTQGRVGIDLEETDAVAIDDFQSQFTTAEWSAITGSARPLLTFYRYWTAKEALIKADGRGLQIPLDSVDVGDYSTIRLEGSHWYLREISIFPGYACHIACENPFGFLAAEEISPNMF